MCLNLKKKRKKKNDRYTLYSYLCMEHVLYSKYVMQCSLFLVCYLCMNDIFCSLKV